MSQDPGDALMDLETDLVDIGNSDGEEIGEDDKAAPKSIKESKGKRKGNSAASEAGSLISTKKGVNKDLLGVKKATKTNNRKCKGCGLYFKPEGMGSKSAFCLKDKHRLDSLTRVAVAQGKRQWIQDVRKDEDKVQKVLKKYDEITGGSGALRSQAFFSIYVYIGASNICCVCSLYCFLFTLLRPSVINSSILPVQNQKSMLFSCLEQTSATSRVQFGTECQMMPEDVYIKHATETLSEGEGRLTKAQANIQWFLDICFCIFVTFSVVFSCMLTLYCLDFSTFCFSFCISIDIIYIPSPRQTWVDLINTSPDTDEIIWDRKGASGSIRVAVAVKDTVTLANIYDRSKMFQAREKEVKDLSDEAVLAKKKQLLSEHDRNVDLDAKAIGAGMVKAAGDGSAGNAFSSNAYEIDIDMLQLPRTPELDEDAEGKDADADGKEEDIDGDKAAEDESKGKGPKKRSFWDRDPAIASKLRAENNAMTTLTMQIETKLQEGREALKDASKRGTTCEQETAMERDTLTKRLQWLEAVCEEGQSSSLQTLKDGVSVSAVAPAVASATSPPPAQGSALPPPAGSTTETTWAEQLGQTPPCDWADVLCFFFNIHTVISY